MYVENILNLAHTTQGAATNSEQRKLESGQTNNTANAQTIQQSTHRYIHKNVWSRLFLWVIIGKNLTNDRSNLIAQTIAQTIARMIKQPIDQLTNLYTNHNLNYWSIDHLFETIYVAISDDVHHHWWPRNGLSVYDVNFTAVAVVYNMHAMPF